MTRSDDVQGDGTSPPFGTVLKQLRTDADLTQELLAERAGVSARLVSDLERGLIGRPRRSTADQLAEGLQLSGPDRDTFIARARGLLPPTAGTFAHVQALPRLATSFVGREADIAALAALLAQPGMRLVTLTGPGGVGKTRLAVEVAARIDDAFAQGVHFVDLTPLGDASLVLPTIAQALGLKPTGVEPLIERLAGWIGRQRLLLVLDNAEHVVEAATDVAALLLACPRLTILATSREPFRIRVEHDLAVDTLPLPGSTLDGSADGLGVVPSVRLFVQRAGAANRAFALTQDNAGVIAAIVSRLDGLPLAIELAAARMKVMPPRALLERLDRRLGLLTGGARDLPARQQTMRTTIDWSYDLLDPDEQRLFRQLAVFSGGFTHDGAEAIAAGGVADGCDVFPLLGALVEKSLVRLEAGDSDEPRYSVLQVIREYGLERLEAAREADMTRRRHALWCLGLAERSGPLLRGHEQAAWLERLDIEHDNFREALRWALDRRDAELAARLASALRRFWVLRGHTREGRRWLEQALAIGHDLTPTSRAGALMAVGVIAYRQGDYARTTALDEALALYRAQDDTTGIAAALANLGMVAQAVGDSHRATGLIEESLGLFRQLGEPARVANQLESLGRLTCDQGDYARAEVVLEEALATARESGNWHGAAFSLNDLALVSHALGDEVRATSLQDEGIELWRSLGNRDGIAQGLENYALFAMAQGHQARAMRLLGAAESLRTQIGAPGRLIDRHRLARLVLQARHHLGEPDCARAREDGHRMTLDDAIGYALGHDGDSTGASTPWKAESPATNSGR